MSTGIKIIFKDGRIDYIDPLVNRTEENGVMTIDNGFHTYDFDLSEIETTELYEVGKS